MRTLAAVIVGLLLSSPALAQQVVSSSAVTWDSGSIPVTGPSDFWGSSPVVDVCTLADAGGALISDPIQKATNSGISFTVRANDGPASVYEYDGGVCADGGLLCLFCSGSCGVDGGPILKTATNATCQLQFSEGEPIGYTWVDAGAGCVVQAVSGTPSFCSFSSAEIYYPLARLYCPAALNYSDGGEICARFFLQGQ